MILKNISINWWIIIYSVIFLIFSTILFLSIWIFLIKLWNIRIRGTNGVGFIPPPIPKAREQAHFIHSTEYSDQSVYSLTGLQDNTFLQTNRHRFAVLDILKTPIYDHHYVMKKHYNDSINLMHTDTGI